MYSLSYVTRRCRLYYLKELFFIINKTMLPAHCGATSLFANNSIFFRSTSKICTDPYSTRRRSTAFIWATYELCTLRSDDESPIPRLDSTQLDLTWLDSSRFDLTRVDLTWVDLTWLDSSQLDLSRLNLSRLDLTRLDLTRLDLTRLDLTRVDMTSLFGKKF